MLWHANGHVECTYIVRLCVKVIWRMSIHSFCHTHTNRLKLKAELLGGGMMIDDSATVSDKMLPKKMIGWKPPNFGIKNASFTSSCVYGRHWWRFAVGPSEKTKTDEQIRACHAMITHWSWKHAENTCIRRRLQLDKKPLCTPMWYPTCRGNFRWK